MEDLLYESDPVRLYAVLGLSSPLPKETTILNFPPLIGETPPRAESILPGSNVTWAAEAGPESAMAIGEVDGSGALAGPAPHPVLQWARLGRTSGCACTGKTHAMCAAGNQEEVRICRLIVFPWEVHRSVCPLRDERALEVLASV